MLWVHRAWDLKSCEFILRVHFGSHKSCEFVATTLVRALMSRVPWTSLMSTYLENLFFFLFKITIHTSYIVRTIHRNGKGSEFTLCSVFCYQEIFTDLITNLTSGQWRVRLSCCVALADFLRAGGAKVFDVSYVNTCTVYFIFLKINHGGTRCLKEEKKTKKKTKILEPELVAASRRSNYRHWIELKSVYKELLYMKFVTWKRKLKFLSFWIINVWR